MPPGEHSPLGALGSKVCHSPRRGGRYQADAFGVLDGTGELNTGRQPAGRLGLMSLRLATW